MSGDPLESSGDLADEFADFDTDERPFCPLTCDLFTMPPEKAAELKARQPPIDPYVDRLAIARMVGAQKDWLRMPGTNAVAYFPPQHATRAWLAATFGPGSYLIQARNAGNQILGNQRLEAGVSPGTAPPGFFHPQSPGAAPGQAYAPAPQYPSNPYAPAAQYAPAPAQPPGETLADKFMASMLRKFSDTLLTPPPAPIPPPAQDFAGIAALVKVIVDSRETPKESTIEKLMLPLLLDALKQPKSNPSDSGSVEKTVAMLKLGAQLFGDKKGKKDDAEGWMEIIPEIVDSIGPALIVSLSQAALPKERADVVASIVEQHMKARTAEAEAQGDTIDTEGETVSP